MPFAAHQKSFTLPSGTTYSYVYHPPSPSNPTLLFLHGFPSTSYEWRHQITYFTALGHGVLAPDLLGYRGSSRPASPSAYLGSIMAADIISILDRENVTFPIVGIAHDWGTYLLSQLAIYYPGRFHKFAFVSLPFRSPGNMMDVHTINKVTKKEMGYPMCEYWLFLTEDGTGKLLGQHWESWFDVVYAMDAKTWKTLLASPGALKSFISTDKRMSLPPFVTSEDKAHHHATFGNDYFHCLNWYHRGINNLGVEEEKVLLESGKIKAKLGKDTLFVPGLKDAMSPAERGKVAMRMAVEEGKLKIVEMDAGHWIMLERADELNRVLEDFIVSSDEKRDEESL